MQPESDPSLQGRGQRIDTSGPLGPQKDIPVPVPPVPDVRNEEGCRDSQAPHAVELIFPRSLAVLDPVPVIAPRVILQSPLVRVQDRLDRGISVSVRPDLPTL